MKEICKAFVKNLSGAEYEGLKKTLPVWGIVFLGLHTAAFQIQIAPFMLYLMVSAFTAGVMWQTLHAEDNAASMKNLFMLPFKRRDLIFSYVFALGVCTFLTKTAGLLAVVLAVSSWSGPEIFGSVLCAVNAVFMTACIYAYRKHRGIGLLWTGLVVGAVFVLRDTAAVLSVTGGNILLAGLGLAGADAYSFYPAKSRKNPAVKGRKNGSAWYGLFRCLTDHKNYLMNTAVMWGVAGVLPAFLRELEGLAVMPVGFAVLSLNTPICILLSCDPALERAVRFLPGQKKAFCIPYCLFLFLCNMAADIVFLCSWQIQVGKVTGMMIMGAVFFALQSAVGSVLLEWYAPIRGWNTESDLWHHPRKYIVPAGMLLLAGAVSEVPVLLPVLAVLLTAEIMILLTICWRC